MQVHPSCWRVNADIYGRKKSLPRVWGHGRRTETEARSRGRDGRRWRWSWGGGEGGDLWEFSVAPGSTHKLLKRTRFDCALVAFPRSESQPQARGMDSIHLFLSLSHTHTHWGISLSPAVCMWWVQSLFRKKKKKLRGRPVSRELHLRFSLLRTVIMHKTSKNRRFIFAFNYFLAQGSTCVRLCVWKYERGARRVHWQGTSTLARASQRNQTKPQGRFCYVWSNKRSDLILKLLSVVLHFCVTEALIFKLGLNLLLFLGGIFLIFLFSFIYQQRCISLARFERVI